MRIARRFQGQLKSQHKWPVAQCAAIVLMESLPEIVALCLNGGAKGRPHRFQAEDKARSTSSRFHLNATSTHVRSFAPFQPAGILRNPFSASEGRPHDFVISKAYNLSY